MPNPHLSDEDIDDLLDLDEQDNPGNELNLHARIQERRRKRAHVAAKQNQMPLDFDNNLSAAQRSSMRDIIREAIVSTDASTDRAGENLQQLLLTVKDCLADEDGDNLENTVHALIRVYRAAWVMMPHLGPIGGE